MKKIRRSNQRGAANHGWLRSQHTFSFGDYYDPEQMGFSALRVINEDRVAPGQGFGTHPHNNMEIFSYVISGELAHRDSMGNGRIIKAGEFQAMSAGSGVTHSEFNPSKTEESHFLQIWIVPDVRGLTPSYAEWKPVAGATETLTLLASPDARAGSVKIHQDAQIFLGRLQSGESCDYTQGKQRKLWLHMIRGEASVDGDTLLSGDAVAVEGEDGIKVVAQRDSELLIFDLP